MSEHEIRRAIVAATEAVEQAWERSGDCADYRAALAELTDLHELYTRATGHMLIGMAA